MNDICENRHRDSPESIDANKRAEPFKHRDRAIAYEIVCAASDGVTSKEISLAMDKPLNAISGRLSELQKDLRIMRRGKDRREGCAVWVPFAVQGRLI